MKYVYPDINYVFDTSKEYVNSIVIENQNMFSSLNYDIYSQLQGCDGKSVLSNDDKVIDFAKNVEFINQFIPFDINTKSLLNRLNAYIEKQALSAEYYEKTMTELSHVEQFLWELTEGVVGDINFTKLSIASIIKAAGIEFENSYDRLGEKIIDYMELIREYDKNKLFILVNIRSYISDSEFAELIKTVKKQLFDVIIIDNCEHQLVAGEKRYIIDKDLCEIECS